MEMQMRKRKLILFIVSAILLIILAAGGFLLFLTIMDFRPEKVKELRVMYGENLPSFNDSVVTIFTWNIGYGGLGKEMDFFHEGGTMVRPDTKKFNDYFEGISDLVKKYNTMDFIFIQEVDRHSKRSYYLDEARELAVNLETRGFSFAKNYDCRYVPVPLNEPMGRVMSGIATYTRFKPSSAERIDYETRFSWPTDMVMLKRCFLVMRFPLASGKEWVLINTHNSVFDSGAVLRRKELKLLHSYVMNDFNKGNYVIIGGDWNMNPRGFIPDSVKTGDKVRRNYPPIGDDFLPGWQFVFDNSRPSNRDVNEPYVLGKTYTTIIDFFVLSPNLEPVSVNTIPAEFANSDHLPVVMKARVRSNRVTK